LKACYDHRTNFIPLYVSIQAEIFLRHFSGLGCQVGASFLVSLWDRSEPGSLLPLPSGNYAVCVHGLHTKWICLGVVDGSFLLIID